MRLRSVLSVCAMAIATCVVPAAAQAADDPGTFVALPSGRILDTRMGIGGAFAVAPGASISVQVAGVEGVPSTNVSAVVLNLTVVKPTSAGYATVYPADATAPTASNLNFVAGRTIANHVTVKLSADGYIKVKNGSSSAANFVADIAGYFVGGVPTSGGTFTPLTPERRLDTRTGIGAAAHAVAPHGSVTLQVGGASGVAADASAAAMNVTVTGATVGGYLTVYPNDEPRPTASNLNFGAGQTIANAVNAALSATGQVTFYNGSGGTVQVIADLDGWFSAVTTNAPGTYVTGTPVRWVDSRSTDPGLTLADGAPVAPWECWVILGAPAGAARAFVLNATVTQPTANGYLVVYGGDGDPMSTPPPNASNINFVKGQTLPNLVTVKSFPDGRFEFCNVSNGTVHVILDLDGLYWETALVIAAAQPSTASVDGGLAAAASRDGATIKRFTMPGH